MIHLKFHKDHVKKIMSQEKRLTMRYGFTPDLRQGQSIRFIDSDQLLFGKAVCLDIYNMSVVNIVDTEWKYHHDYNSIQDFRMRFNAFYPDVDFNPETQITVIEWGRTFRPIRDYFR